MRILTVCTGNICRSPMAEALLARALDKTFIVSSAGVAALIGYPADPLAREVCDARGFDIGSHIARPVEKKSLLEQDLILTMEQAQSLWLSRNCPQAHGRIFLLGNWRGKIDIPDPYGKSKEVFEDAFDLIQDCCRDWSMRVTS